MKKYSIKKYGKFMTIAFAAFFASSLPAFAKEYTLDSFSKKLNKDYPKAGYVYVIGSYAFTSNHPLTTQDVMLAARSIKLSQEDSAGEQTDKGNAYKKMTISYLEKNGSSWTIETPEVGDETLEEEKFNVTYIDYDFAAEKYIEDDVDPAVANAVEDLNKNAKTFGFNEVTFTQKTVVEKTQKTITFAVHDLNKPVSTYAETASTMFKNVLEKLELKEIKYKVGETEKTVKPDDVKDTSKIVGFAKDLIKEMAGVQDNNLSTVTYASLIGKEAHATFIFEVDGKEYQEDYYVTFTYDFEKDKDADLTEAANELNKKVQAEEGKKYGFREISYDSETRTAEFAIQDDSVKLATFMETGIAKMFENYITGATKVKYTYGKVSKEITFDKNGSAPTEANAIKWAKELLCLMSQDSDSAQDQTSCNAANLILANVAGKEATAEITYKLNDGEEKTITYTLRFTYELEEVKNYELTDSAKTLNENLKQEDKDYGFSSITYDPETNTINFEVSKEDSKLVNFAESGIMEMFAKFADNATKVTYTVNGNTTQYSEEIINHVLSGVEIKKFAARLLMRMAGKEVQDNDQNLTDALNLTVADVAGKEAKATFTFVVDGKEIPMEYNLKFNYEVEEVKKSELTTFAKQLNDKLKESSGTNYGFESIDYNPETGKVTFTAKKGSENTTLVTFASSGIIDMFNTFITNATSVKYKVNGGEYGEAISLTELAEGETTTKKIMELAATLLLDMAGKNDSTASVTSTSSSQDWSKAKELKISDVVGKSAEAVFTYQVGEETKNMTFTLEFVAAAETE